MMISTCTDGSARYFPTLEAGRVEKLVPPEPFKAEYPDCLKRTRLQSICRIAYNIFSVLFFPLGICRLIGHRLHLMAGRSIVPAQKNTDAALLKKARESLISDFQGSPVSFKTPDGKLLDGMHIPGKKEGKNVSKQAPTIICFNGNGEHYEMKSASMNIEIKSEKESIVIEVPFSNLSQFIEQGYNVMLFNYRGVGHSQGQATRDGLILDGEAAYQYVQKHLGVPAEQITLFGHSLGGGVATQVAAMHPGVQLCNVRSFASLEKTVRVLFGKIAPWMGFIVSRALVALRWNLDSEAKWAKVKGRKWIVYHPHDQIIPTEAGLYQNLQKRKKPVQAFALHHKEAVEAYCQELAAQEKGRALTSGEIQLANSAASDIANPHNRALLPHEMRELFALWV